GKMERIRNDPFLGPRIVAMSPTMEVFAMMQFHYPDGRPVTRVVKLIGIDPATRIAVGGFKEHLSLQKSSDAPGFAIPESARIRYENREQMLRMIQEQEERRNARFGEPPPPTPPAFRPHLPHGAI